MRTSYNWLKDYCAFELPAHELAAQLSHSGLNVESFEPRHDDYMLDVEVKSNRPDCLCHLGVAREIAAIVGAAAQRPALDLPAPSGRPIDEAATVQVDAPDLCPHYTARVLTGVRVGPSPDWLQHRLTVCGVRPVNNVVDVTNYVLLECGQPLHAFDLARMGGRRIVVRRAQAGEVITVIDGTEHALIGEECVIADERKPVALAGVMGGLESEIGESTNEVLIEAARFDPMSIRRASRRHALSSDSSYHFERGIDPEITDWASRRACQLILEIAGGELLAGVADIRSDTTQTPEVTMRFSRLTHLLGIHVPRQEVLGIFAGLDLALTDEAQDCVTVRVPSWRADLRREVDLIEEVARIHGYDKIAETTAMTVRAVAPSADEVLRRRARALLAGQGFTEVMSYSLISPTDLQRAQPWHEGEPLAVRNPISADRTHLRLTHMANLLHATGFNAARGARGVQLFELGHLYLPRQGEQLPEQKRCLALLSEAEDGLRRLKGTLANVMDELGIEQEPEEEPGAAGPFAEGESVEFRLDGELLGCAGLTAPQIAGELDLTTRPALLEVDFGLLVERGALAPTYQPIAPYPAATRDLALIVAEDVLWADFEACIRRHAPETLESIDLFDVYRGEPVPPGHKSAAFSMTFRRADRTITAEEARQAGVAILNGLRRELNAELR